MIEIILGTGATRALATSALPDAPVVSGATPAPPRARIAAATLLRRAADRLAPDPRGLPAH